MHQHPQLYHTLLHNTNSHSSVHSIHPSIDPKSRIQSSNQRHRTFCIHRRRSILPQHQRKRCGQLQIPRQLQSLCRTPETARRIRGISGCAVVACLVPPKVRRSSLVASFGTDQSSHATTTAATTTESQSVSWSHTHHHADTTQEECACGSCCCCSIGRFAGRLG